MKRTELHSLVHLIDHFLPGYITLTMSPEVGRFVREALVTKLREVQHDCEVFRVTCQSCNRSWCERCDPAPLALCHFCHGRGSSTAELENSDLAEQPTTSHLIGPGITFETFMRQTCLWCGSLLTDLDLSTVMIPEDQEPPGFWPDNRWLRVTSGNPRMSEVIDEEALESDKAPADSCMAFTATSRKKDLT